MWIWGRLRVHATCVVIEESAAFLVNEVLRRTSRSARN